MMPVVRTLERVIKRAPLGLRFLDMTRGVFVNDGLTVTAWQLGTADNRIVASRSPISGVYGFRTLPGLHQFEVGEAPATDWCPVPAGGGSPADNYVVLVEDTEGRFLPQVLTMCLPKEQLLEVPLFPAPARRALGGFALLTGELWDQQDNRPAGWARVTATTDGTTYAGMADRRGMFTLFMPYANALPPLTGNPPQPSVDIEHLTWDVTIRVFYQPSAQRLVTNLDPSYPPDMRSILAQGQAQVFGRPPPDQPHSVVERSLRFGETLVVATNDLPRLLVNRLP